MASCSQQTGQEAAAQTAACVQHITMQDADAQHDQTSMLKKASTASMASPGRPSKPGTQQASSRPDGRSAAASKPMSVAAAAARDAAQKDCTQTAKAPAAGKPAPAAPTSKRQKTAGSKKAPAGRKAAAESESESEAAGDSDADEPDAAAAASAAAEAATFTPDEVTEVNTSLLKWYDRVMRILPWRRNPHHKPEQQQETPATAATAAAAAAAGSSSGGSSGSSKLKQKKSSKAELAAAEAAAVVAAAKPAPAELSPQQFAYYVWVSEIMLQQTQVARVITYFNKWIAAWPTVQDLAQATQEQVNEVWAGLGYYRRARYLLEGARFVVDKLDGSFPETAAGMRQIPGVGPYTAAAVASIAFSDCAAAVDGNVIRVVARLRALGGNPTKLVKAWDRLAGQLLHSERPGCHNQAMMELGATVCKPVNPLCEVCPVSSCCAAYKQVRAYAEAGGSPDVEDAPRVTDYPEKVAKAAKHEQHVAVCVLKVLLLPGVNTPAELEEAAAVAAAVAAAAGSSGGTIAASSKRHKGAAAPAAAAGASKQGKINAFFRPAAKPAAAAGVEAGQQQQQQVELCEQDVLAAGGSAHYLLVQRPATGLLAGLWEFPGVMTEGEVSHKARRAAAYTYLTDTLGIQAPLQPGTGAAAAAAAGTAAAKGTAVKGAADEARQSVGGGAAGVRVLHQRQLGSAVHIFSHIRQTLHAEELVLLAPSLDAVCPTTAAAAADEEKVAGAAAGSSGSGSSSKQKKRKAADSREGGVGDGEVATGAAAAAAAAAGGGRPSVRWVAAAEIGQAGLTSGVRKVLQLSLK